MRAPTNAEFQILAKALGNGGFLHRSTLTDEEKVIADLALESGLLRPSRFVADKDTLWMNEDGEFFPFTS